MLFRSLAATLLAAFTLTAAAQTTPPRPRITGISHLAIYTSDLAATDHYYTRDRRRRQAPRSRESAGRPLRPQPHAVH